MAQQLLENISSEISSKLYYNNMSLFFTAVKMVLFRLKIVIFFLILAQNIDSVLVMWF